MSPHREEAFRLMFAANPLPMWVYDLSTLRFVEVNDAAVEHYGYTRDEFLQMRITDIRPPEDVPRLLEDLAQPRPPLQSSGEWRHRRRDGEIIDVQIASHRLTLNGRDVALVVANDITERKRIETERESLLARERTARTQAEGAQRRSTFLAEAGKLLSASLDYRATLASVARAAVPHVADWSSVDMIKPDGSLERLAVAHQDPAKVELAYALQRRYPSDPSRPGPIHDALQSRQPVFAAEIPPALLDALNEEQRRLLTDLGLQSYIVAPIVLAGRAVGLITMVTAESGRRYSPEDMEMAEELARRAALAIENAMHYQQAQILNLELERRVADRTTQLEDANKELEAFSYSVAHDLRAPLRAMDGFSRLVVEEYGPQVPPDAHRYLERVRQSAVQMGHLIDDLLTFARLARQPLQRQRVNTAGLVRQVVEQARGEDDGRAATITVGDLPECNADPALLRQVFANLISNAVKFSRTRDEPRIEVAARGHGGGATYMVRDNGVGFDMRYADKLFGVFQRLHRAEEYEGTGVGLAIVQRIVHRHGGRVWADSAPDKGAAFYFTLEETADGQRPGGNPAG